MFLKKASILQSSFIPLIICLYFSFFSLIFASIPIPGIANGSYCSQLGTNACYSLTQDLANKTSYNIGDFSTIYITAIANYTGLNTTWTNYTAQFFPKIDDWSALTIPGSTQLILTDEPYVMVSVLYNNTIMTVDPMPWIDVETQEAVQGRTIIINMQNGQMMSLGWEDSSCQRAFQAQCTCVAGVCATACNLNSTCDFKIYVGWAGTDAQGNDLTSASLSLQNFRLFI